VIALGVRHYWAETCIHVVGSPLVLSSLCADPARTRYLNQTPAAVQSEPVVIEFLKSLQKCVCHLDGTACSVGSRWLAQCPRSRCATCLATARYPLTRFERLQLLNFRPGSEVLFLRLVEEGEERFSTEVIAEILELIERILPARGKGPGYV
jgi:hypothetical protein